MSYLRSEARQRQILSCAKRVFAERGFHAANVSHICEAAGIGRGTLYQYFANKQAVLTAILRETLDRVRGVMERQQPARFPRPEKISRAVAIDFSARQLRELLEVVFEDEHTLRILLREAVGLDVDVEKILGEIDAALIGVVERNLAEAFAAGFIRELDTRMVATMVVGGVEKLALAALRGETAIESSGSAGARSDAQRRGESIDLERLALEATRLHAIGILSDRLEQ